MQQVRVAGPVLTGEGTDLDPREAAFRPDLADIALAGRIAVPHYARPVLREVQMARATLRGEPGEEAPAVSQLLLGERFALLDVSGATGWGYGLHDHYVGYLDLAALGPVAEMAGDRRLVGPGDGLILAEPRVKASVVAEVPAGAELVVKTEDERFCEVVAGPFEGGFVHLKHLVDPGLDWVGVAEGFLGSPYRWGGRSRTGVDCSGLIQLAWKLAGRPARRDSDMLFADAGEEVADGAPLQRGDVAWWPGHIGVMVDEARLLHANAFWMTTLIEPLAVVAERAGAWPRIRRPA
jgi:hypothetical protein